MSKHILVVGTSPTWLEDLSSALLSVGVGVVPVPTLMQGKRSLVLNLPSMIICNSSIQGQSDAALSFLKEIRNHGSLNDVPFVIFIGKDDKSETSYLAQGATLCLSEGLSKGRILEAISPFLSLRVEEMQELCPRKIPETHSAPASIEDAPIEAGMEDQEEGDSTELSNVEQAQLFLAKALYNIKHRRGFEDIPPSEVAKEVALEVARVCGVESL